MKKTTILVIATVLMASAAGLFAYDTGTGHGPSAPDSASTCLLIGIAASGLYGVRRFLKK